MDKYDNAIRILKEDPTQIDAAWNYPAHHPAGCLFQYCSPNGDMYYKDDCYGCITQVKARHEDAYDSEITELIRNNPNIPSCVGEITVEHLNEFAVLNRHMDLIWNRK